jgi:hypothetical protein
MTFQDTIASPKRGLSADIFMQTFVENLSIGGKMWKLHDFPIIFRCNCVLNQEAKLWTAIMRSNIKNLIREKNAHDVSAAPQLKQLAPFRILSRCVEKRCFLFQLKLYTYCVTRD